MLWQIRDDESEEASELRQLLEDFVQERMQRIALDNFSAFESPTEWLEMGDGLESVAKDIRDTGLSINDGVAAAIAKMKAEAAEDAVVFESEDWRDLRSRLLVALQECNGDSLRLV